MLGWMLGFATAAAGPGVRVADATDPIVVDGRLDEAAWTEASPVTVFERFQPVPGPAPAGVTEVRFVQDERGLYVGIRVRDAAAPIRARISPREDINSDDQVGVYLDTFGDGRTGYIFYLNPLGIQQDIRHNTGTWNTNWDTVLWSEGTVDEDGRGYTIELGIPWRSIKYPAADGRQTWGLILTRKIPGEGAKYGFPHLERNHPLLFAQAAELQDVAPAGRGSGLELIPALTLAQDWSEDPETGVGPALDTLDLDPLGAAIRPSLDLRYGLTPDLGLTGTVNPDFSQVEADVADVRLNARFAFRFPERRPFFLDGIDAYEDRSDTLYTRSIAEPLYGAKVTGREGPVAVGVMHALDRSPLPSFHEAGTPGFDDTDVDGRQALDTVARARVDAFGNGYVGLTLADKRLIGGPGQPGAAGTNDTAAVDLSVPLGGRWLAGGSTQHALTSDGDGPAAWGTATEAAVVRNSGVGTGLSLSVGGVTPDFRRETGFLTQSDLVRADGWIDHTFAGHGALTTVTPGLSAGTLIEGNGDRYDRGGAGTTVVLDGVHHVWLEGGADRRIEQGAEVVGGSVDLGYAGQVGRVLEWSPSANVVRGLDFGTLGPALTAGAALDAAIRATVGTRLDLTASATRHLPEGLDPETATLLRARFAWQFTRPLGTRWIVQHDRVAQRLGTDEQLLISGLLTWLDRPGTGAWLGWTEIVDLQDPTRTTERVLFLKGSVLLRP